MKIAEVAKLPPFERLAYWIKERHAIHLRRQAGKPKPWTDDEVLQSFFFTNPYRENDKTTVWFRQNVRDPLRDDPRVLFATIAFRWFNKIETAQVLMAHDEGDDLLLSWDEREAVRRLKKANEVGPVFTGAYMIKSQTGMPKIDGVCKSITKYWKRQESLLERVEGATTLQEAHKALLGEYLGGFMAYEIVTDLRWTYLLEAATDTMTWCNPGPGCKRGIRRLVGDDLPRRKSGSMKRSVSAPMGWQEVMLETLARIRKRILPFEMRDLEHSLCEWDKHERARLNDGKMKRRYRGV